MLAVSADLPLLADAVWPIAMRASDVGGELQKWVMDSFQRAPALVLGLAALLTLPPLAVLGWLFGLGRRKATPRSGGERTVAIRRERGPLLAGKPPPPERRTTAGPIWPTESWLETTGAEASRHRIGNAVIRIGREADNEICLPQKTVHRYHAAVHRTSDAEVLITDLASADGNGVIVNGKRVREARLENGDVIRLGEAELIFTAKPK